MKRVLGIGHQRLMNWRLSNGYSLRTAADIIQEQARRYQPDVNVSHASVDVWEKNKVPALDSVKIALSDLAGIGRLDWIPK